MKRFTKIALAVLILLVVGGGVRFWASKTPLKLGGKVFDSVTECAVNQKNLYKALEAYAEEHGKIGDGLDVSAMLFEMNLTSQFGYCPMAKEEQAWAYCYKIYPENYGKAGAVFIEESKNKHPGSFMYWVRGFHPRVKTMGDGVIQMFKGGKVATMNAG